MLYDICLCIYSYCIFDYTLVYTIYHILTYSYTNLYYPIYRWVSDNYNNVILNGSVAVIQDFPSTIRLEYEALLNGLQAVFSKKIKNIIIRSCSPMVVSHLLYGHRYPLFISVYKNLSEIHIAINKIISKFQHFSIGTYVYTYIYTVILYLYYTIHIYYTLFILSYTIRCTYTVLYSVYSCTLLYLHICILYYTYTNYTYTPYTTPYTLSLFLPL